MIKILIFFALLAIQCIAGERSHQWPALRNRYISNHPICECCGSAQDPQVHHIVPVKADPGQELNYGNLITLCKKKCHLKVGHGGSYQFYNPLVRDHIKLNCDLETKIKLARKSRIKNIEGTNSKENTKSIWQLFN